jgi:ribonucleoside-triphosphate reductase
MNRVLKRDGREVDFNKDKIIEAISNANTEVIKSKQLSKKKIKQIADIIEEKCEEFKKAIKVDDINDLVEDELICRNYNQLVRAFIQYRYNKELIRKSNTTDKSIKELLEGENDYWNKENSNKNARVVTTQRDYIAGISSTDISERLLLPQDVVKAHKEGIIHFHDMDYFAQNALHNCDLINLEDMLENGTVINGILIEKPHRIITAATIATQIITAVASSQYGGCTISLTHLAPFVRSSYEIYVEKYRTRGLSDADCIKFAEQDLRKEVQDAVQTFNYQINSMSTTNGQAPFLSVNMYLGETKQYKPELAMLIEEFLNQRILGLKNEKGVYITPAFPKLLYVLEEDNIRPDSKYYYLTELAAKCTAKRMVPDYISEKMMRELKHSAFESDDCYPCMGCRSFLTPDRFTPTQGNVAKAKNYDASSSKYYGRFNQGVVTINLVDVALSCKGDITKFWSLLNDRLELCHRALRCRHERLLGKKSDMAPILWQHGALARLQSGEKIDKLLYNGYSTISLGYAGLYECVKFMTGKSHTDNGEGKEFGLQVMRVLNDACAKWKAAENIDYSVYGSPIESTTYKFAKCLKKRFGVIKGITDKDYITNSYHVPVTEEIDAFSKLTLESEFQQLSPGGAISYVETSNLQNNLSAVMEVIKFIYDNIMYAELNTKSDYCQVCGYDGEILINDKLEWYCPNCGNKDTSKMNVARRTCGYIGSNFWNEGRTQEIAERVIHLDNKEL